MKTNLKQHITIVLTMRHLIFVQHGMFGFSYFFDNFKKTMESTIKDSIVFLPSANNFVLSTMGTKRCGTNLANYIENKIKLYPEAETVSYIGHSFGGVLGRYAIGLLHERDPQIFDKIKPLAFVTISTPHLGVTTNESHVKWALKYFTGPTGKELILKDSASDLNDPILYEISEKDSSYMIALDKFKVKMLYGNLYNDTVSYESACMCTTLPLDATNIKDYLIEVVPERLFVINQNVDTSNPDDKFKALKEINWIKKVADLKEYTNSHITIVGRHTFIPFLEVNECEGSIVVLDIIYEMLKHV